MNSTVERFGEMMAHIKERVRPAYLRNVYFRIDPRNRPEYFEQCWQFDRLESSLDTPAEGVIFLPMSDWHVRFQRSQQFALRLGEAGFRVLYLNPHLGREFRKVPDRSKAAEIRQLRDNVWELHVHLLREPVFHHRLLSSEEQFILAEALEAAGEKLGFERAVQIISFPVWGGTALTLRERLGWPILYDCHDFIGGFSRIAPSIVQTEPSIIGASDVGLFSSETLMDLNKALQPERVLIRNGVDRSFIREDREARKCDGVQSVTYVGSLDDWIDVPAIEAAAREHSSVVFRLFGRVESAGIKCLEQYSNVHLEGECPHSQVADILEQSSAAIIPFKLNHLTRAVDPIKAYEYLALGLPVISSELPELDRFRDLMYIYRTPAEFCSAIGAALAERDEKMSRRRRAAILRETWEERTDALVQQIGLCTGTRCLSLKGDDQ
jgi:glycosyltransferase involved in cell wall biosynthesis